MIRRTYPTPARYLAESRHAPSLLGSSLRLFHLILPHLQSTQLPFRKPTAPSTPIRWAVLPCCSRVSSFLSFHPISRAAFCLIFIAECVAPALPSPFSPPRACFLSSLALFCAARCRAGQESRRCAEWGGRCNSALRLLPRSPANRVIKPKSPFRAARRVRLRRAPSAASPPIETRTDAATGFQIGSHGTRESGPPERQEGHATGIQ